MALGQKEIRLSIKANTAKFETELKKLPGMTDKEAKKMASKMAKQFDKMNQKAKKSADKMTKDYKGGFSRMTAAASNFKNVLAAGVFAAAAKGLWNLANAASEYTDKIMLMHNQTGIASRTLIGLEYAAVAAGSSFDEAIKPAIEGMVGKMTEANRATDQSVTVLGRLGVAAVDAGGNLRSTESIFRDSIDALAGLENSAERAAFASELFGGGAAKITAILNDGSGSIDQWAASAEAAGISMDSGALRASAEADRAMAQLNLTVRGFVQTSGNELIPTMVKVAESMAFVVGKIAEGIVLWDNFTSSLFGAANEADQAREQWDDVTRAYLRLNNELRDSDQLMISFNGATARGSTLAREMTQTYNDASGAFMSLANGAELSQEEITRLFNIMHKAEPAAGQLGLNFAAMVEEERQAREATEDLGGEIDALLSDLDSGIPTLETLNQTVELTGEALANLNRQFQLNLMRETDPALAAYESRLDAINDAVERGLEPALAAEAIKQNEAELMEARTAAMLEYRGAIDEVAIATGRAAAADEILAQRAEEAAVRQQKLDNVFGASSTAMDGFFDLANEMSAENAEDQKTLAIMQTTINGLAAGIRAFADLGPVAGAIASAGIAASTAAAIASITSTPVPTMHSGGIVGADTMVNAQGGEAILNREAVAQIGSNGVQSLNEGGGVSQPIVIEMTYRQKVLDRLVVDNLKKGGALAEALHQTGRRASRGMTGGLLL